MWLTIGIPIIATVIMGLVGWAVSLAMGRVRDNMNHVMDKVLDIGKQLQEHKANCDKVNKEVLNSQLDVLQEDMKQVQPTVQWMATCLMILGATMKVTLPNQP